MNERRFFNPSQPQTLQIAVLLLYLNAALDFLFYFGSPVFLLIALGMAAGAYGIANEQKWGYGLAVTIAVLRVALLLLAFQLAVLEFPLIITFIFDSALVALLVHPESRDYQRIWFK